MDSGIRETRRSRKSSLGVHLLGLVDYESAALLQERLIYEVRGGEGSDGSLLLCEFPPVITVGREGRSSDVLVDEQELVSHEMGVKWVSRGGGAFVHGPGQLAVIPVLRLDRLGWGMSEYRRRLEMGVARACRDLQVLTKRCEDAPGLWSRLGHLAFFGSVVKNCVTSQGMFLNVSIDPGFLKMVNSNAAGVPATTMEAVRHAPVPMAKVREAVIRRVSEHLGFERMHVFTGHPLLVRTRRTICQHA